ncbi:ABC transporter ATP-binding protein [Acaryochloris sp. IP29b_bin.137]|uniref:ABC transporter ATP-binding protein n=1 Tax=Acaryochloris sp. IP29b_bin.137 TaxID=2969217 RepID=UPI002627F2E4|nr:ABC transporter ATP-binding protein [Acaryochloris sp. IP29b_bin.137]
MTDPILQIRNLRVQFQTEGQRVNAVDGVSLTLPRGQTLGIVGESGSGKSVTSLSVMRLVPTPPGQIVEGEIWFQGASPDTADANNEQSNPVDLLQLPISAMQAYRGSQISMIFQEPMSSLNPVYTCGFQIVEALRLHDDLSAAAARRRAMALLQEVKLIPPDAELQQMVLETAGKESASLSETELQKQVNRQKRSYLNRYPHQLSGGQIQRVMIAMAIASNPAILIADEPTTALDVTVQATILDLLRELRDRRQMSIIFVTHDLGIVAELADTVAVMYQGQVVETGTAQEIFENPQHPYTRGLLACRPRPDQRLKRLPTVADFMASEPSETQDLDPVTDPPITDAPLSPAQPEMSESDMQDRLETLTQQPPLLRVQNLQVFFPVKGMFGKTVRYVTAVNNVSFDVYPGETLGLVGESGCGKTTLGRTLVRLIKPTSGNILYNGRDITQLRGRHLRKLRQNLQIIFQDPYSSLDPRMNVGTAIMEPMRIAGGITDRIAAEQGGNTPRDRAAYLLERVGLTPNDMSRYPHEFSGGQRQRICIARALALNPKFIICDESVSALDVSVQAQVLNLLKELQREFDLTYIFISHDLSVVKFMSDRIMVMNRGKLEEIGAADQIYCHPQAEYTRKLIASIPAGLPTQPKTA